MCFSLLTGKDEEVPLLTQQGNCGHLCCLWAADRQIDRKRHWSSKWWQKYEGDEKEMDQRRRDMCFFDLCLLRDCMLSVPGVCSKSLF